MYPALADEVFGDGEPTQPSSLNLLPNSLETKYKGSHMSYLLIGLLLVLVGSITSLWLMLAGSLLLTIYIWQCLRLLFR